MEPLFSENTPTTLFTSAKNKKKKIEKLINY